MRLFLLFILLCCVNSLDAENLRLWYSAPAKNWWEALPVGNSHIGGMVYGGTTREEIQINEETFWSGSPYNNDRVGADAYLESVREYIFEGRNAEAGKILDEKFFTGNHGMRYLTLGSVFLDFINTGVVDEYCRELNLGNAIATTEYISNGVKYTRTVFSSFSGNVIVINMNSDKGKIQDFDLSYSCPLAVSIENIGSDLIVKCEGVEHGPNGVSITAGCTMDNQLAFDVLENTRLAAEILGESDRYIDSLKSMVTRLPPMRIGRYNQLQEWMEDLDNPNDKHRHISHLYGLYPSNQISPYSNPLLFQAAKNTLLQRGDMATGWSIGWKINFWARMFDGNHAYRIIKNMLKILPGDDVVKDYPEGRTYPNMLDAHPPFQIDGNFGFTAGIAEMLLQSHDGAVHILPSLPEQWKEGKVTGLVARGGFVVDIEWKEGATKKIVVHSRIGGTLRLRSYVPLKCKGLKKAKGECPNILYSSAKILQPLISDELDLPEKPDLRQVYEYDIETIAGKDYVILNK